MYLTLRFLFILRNFLKFIPEKNNFNREIQSISSDACTLASSNKEKLDRNSTSNIDSEENINISERILPDETDIIQTTYSRDFPNKRSSTLIALRYVINDEID